MTRLKTTDAAAKIAITGPTRRAIGVGALMASVIAVVGGLSATPAALAQAYPSTQPIKLIVPYPPGGATDILARTFAPKLGENWKIQVVVENRAGAGGTIGAQAVAKAAPDGHTVLFSIVALVQQITLMNLPYDPFKDFIPITRVAISPSILAVNKDLPVNNAKELLALVKSQPGKHSFGTYGVGTSSHLQGSLVNLAGGLDMTHVPFAGGAALVNSMLGGQISIAFLDAGSSKPNLSKFKLLGTTGSTRISWLPEVPSLKEQGLSGFEPMGWFGMFLPAGTPRDIVAKFHAEAASILKGPEMTGRIDSMGLIQVVDTPEQFGEVMKADAAVYARIIKEANIKLN